MSGRQQSNILSPPKNGRAVWIDTEQGRTNPSDFLSDLDYQKQILGGVSRTFALTIPQLPPGLTNLVTNAYLLCRIIDTIEDEESLTIEQKRLFLQEFIDVASGRASAVNFANALFPMLSKSSLPAERELIQNTPCIVRITRSFTKKQQSILERCLVIMSRGMERFQENKSVHGLKDVSQLDSYCYHVAGVVGELLTELFCDHSTEIAKNRETLLRLARSFGQGLQMTNILKDLWEDRNGGVCWLPQDVFYRTGFDLKDLTQGQYCHAFGDGLSILVAIAHAHLKNALRYTLIIPRCEKGIRRFCLWAIAMAIFTLKNIENKRDFSMGREVKISRRTVKRIIIITNLTLRSNLLLKMLFDLSARGLPISKIGSRLPGR